MRKVQSCFAAALLFLGGIAAAHAESGCVLKKTADLPLELDVISGLPTITVALNGNALRLLVDLAAPVSLIGAPAAERLGLKYAHASADGISIGVGRESTDLYVRQSTLLIGHITFSKPLFFISKKTHQFSAVADGVIGMNILRAADIELDFPARRFRLFDSAGCGENVVYWQGAYSALPLDRNFFHIPVFRAVLDGAPLMSTINTASMQTSLVDKDRCRPTGQYGSFSELGLGEGLALSHPRISYQCDSVCPTNFDDAIPKLSVGLPQINHFRLYIADHAQKIFFIVPSAASH